MTENSEVQELLRHRKSVHHVFCPSGDWRSCTQSPRYHSSPSMLKYHTAMQMLLKNVWRCGKISRVNVKVKKHTDINVIYFLLTYFFVTICLHNEHTCHGDFYMSVTLQFFLLKISFPSILSIFIFPISSFFPFKFLPPPSLPTCHSLSYLNKFFLLPLIHRLFGLLFMLWACHLFLKGLLENTFLTSCQH